MKSRTLSCGIVVALLTVGNEGVSISAIDSPARPTGGVANQSPDMKGLVAGNSRFAVDLYRKLGEKEGNVFFSPYSVSTAPAMAYAGARENTQKEMAATLHFSLEQEKLHPAFSPLQARLKDIQRAGVIDLYVANSLWP